MAAPSLRIPLSVPTDQLQRDMENAGSVTRTATRQIVQNFASANREILTSTAAAAAAMSREYAASAARAAAAWAAPRLAIIAGAIAAKEAITAVVDAVREQLREIIELADQANKVNVNPEFFQSFLSGSRNMRIEAKSLEDALVNAFQAVKDKIDPNWTVFDEGKRKISEVEKSLREMRELFSTDQGFKGLDLFRGAADQEGRVRAVLIAMTELQRIGQDLAALDLGEKMFGSQFVDNIRRGNISAQEMLAALENAPKFSAQLVAETKEVDRALASANERLSREMAPTYETIISSVNAIKSLWAQIVDLIASAVSKIGNLANLLPPLASLKFLPGIGPLATGIDAARMLVPPTSDLSSLSADEAQRTATSRTTAGNVPFPQRRPFNAPDPKIAKEAREQADAFENAVTWIDRHIASLQADAATVGLTRVQHEQLRAEMRLLEAARQSDIAITDEQMAAYARLRAQGLAPLQALQQAGITLNDEQAASFVRLSERMGLVVGAAERAKTAFQGTNDALKFAGNTLVDVIDRATQKGANFGEIMKDVLRSITRELLRAAITGEGAFAKMLGLASNIPGGTGGLLGGLGNVFSSAGPTIGAFAEGGTIPAGGLGLVGEHGANPRLIRAGAEPIMVTPNEIKGAGGGNSVTVSPTYHINASGADVKTVERLQAALFAVNQSLEGRVRSTVTEDSRRRMRR